MFGLGLHEVGQQGIYSFFILFPYKAYHFASSYQELRSMGDLIHPLSPSFPRFIWIGGTLAQQRAPSFSRSHTQDST